MEERSVSYPGQLLGENVRKGENVYIKDGKAYSLMRGLVNIRDETVSVIPVRGAYIAKPGDFVTGIVSDDFGKVKLVDIHSPYPGVIRGGDDKHRKEVELSPGDIVNAKVVSVGETKEPQLASPWKLEGGVVIEVDPKKIPRVIGKKKSMINMIKEKTGCRIMVGQNGLIWINGDKTDIAVKTIKTIEEQAHTPGLTDRVGAMLDEMIKN